MKTDPGRRNRLGRLFERAARLAPHERASFLERACADDDDMRLELLSLLTSHDAEPAFLERLGARVMPTVLDGWLDEMPQLGDEADRYVLIERIGAGGMGIVYRARDRVLGRIVALKFLPYHLNADDSARIALTREARAASALDHPNIGVIHDIASVDRGERLCIAMAYYEGETLHERIARAPLDIADTLSIATQLADGLAAAHEAGIVHRDMKPANILITRAGQVRILDFGLAQVSDSEWTGGAGAVGTAAYMSPEQTRGQTVDHRSDIWSLGVILYEMLARVRPFRGAGVEEMLSAVRTDEPPPLAAVRPDVPPRLAAAVHRCLAKDASARYGSARDLLSDLREMSAGVQEGDLSLIVLPFANISADPGNDYFSAGLTEEVIADLSHIRALRVISRTSAMRYHQSDKDLRTIAQEVGVRYVLEGGVRKENAAVRITVRLIDAVDDRQLWSRKFSGKVEDVFAMQEGVAHAIADALRIQLSHTETTALAHRPIGDPRAYESYLRARHEAWSFSREALERARRHIEAALEIVGDNELLYGTLGQIMAAHLEAGIDPDGRARERVAELAARAFALNPDSASGHFLQAFVAFHRADMAGAMHAGERARSLAPDHPDTLLLLSYVYAHVGRTDDARSILDHVLELDPLTPLTHAVCGFIYVMEGRFGEAVAHYRRCHELDPDNAFGAVCYGWALAYEGNVTESLDVLDAAADRFRGTPFESWAATLACALRGDGPGVVRAITPMMQAAARDSEMFARALAQACALGGETELAFTWLEREIDLGMLNYDFLAVHDRFLAPLREHARFAELLGRVQARLSTLKAQQLASPQAR